MSDVKYTLTKEELLNLVDAASTEKASKIATEAIEAKIKELGLAKTENKFAKGSFASLSEDQKKGLNVKAKMASFIQALAKKDVASLAQFKDMSEGTDSAGGFLVPQEFAAEVFRVVEDFGLVPKLARKFPMNRDILNVPRLGTTISGSYPGENTAGSPSTPVFQRVVLTAKTYVGITPMSNEVLEDANVEIIDLLVELFAENIAGTLDAQGLAGTGSPFTGILSDSGVTTVVAASGMSTFTLAATPDNARLLIANVKPWSLQGASYIMHRTVWSQIQTAKASGSGEYFASAANPIMNPSAVQGFPNAIAGVLWGYPVYCSDKMPALSATAIDTKFIIFGNLKHLWLGMRKDMNVLISEHATVGSDNLFAANMSAVRVTTRHAVAVGLPTAFSVLVTSHS